MTTSTIGLTMATTISKERIDRFRDRGYLVLENAFSEAEVDRLQSEADRILEVIINSSLANDRSSGRLILAEHPDGKQSVRKVQPVGDLSLPIAKIATDERLIEPMAAYMDDEPRLMEEKLNYKQPLPNRVEGIDTSRPSDSWPVHSDWAYFKTQNYPKDIVSSAVAIDDLTEANGTLRLWPGSEYVEHETTEDGLKEVPQAALDDAESELIEAPAGSVILFNSTVWHGSSANTTDRPRRLLIFSHYPGEAGDELGIKEDERNAPARLRESPYEWEYQRLKDAGEFTDQFEAPSYD